jgi:lysophospholipase L1-like esterase
MTEGTTSPTFTPFALTAGKPESYPFKLQTLIMARYSAQTIIVSNGGRGGEHATAGRDRIGSVLSDARPDLVILLEGANDLNSLNSMGLTDVSPIVAAMEDMVRASTGRGAQVIVATLPPQRSGGNSKGNAGPLLSKYNNDLKTMVSRRGAMLIDVNALLPLSLIGQDGLHPTEAGYQMMAETFLEVIKAKYEVTANAIR